MTNNDQFNIKYETESIAELAKALVLAQAKIEGAKKTSENPFFKSKYADLAEVWEVIREPLTSNGLSITQTTCVINDKIYLKTKLIHISGQWIESYYPIFVKDYSPQTIGSALSYGRRYQLSAIVGVYQDDDDGNTAQKVYEENRAQLKPGFKTTVGVKPQTAGRNLSPNLAQKVPQPTEFDPNFDK